MLLLKALGAVLVLPGSVLVLLPFLILGRNAFAAFGADDVPFWIGLMTGGAGVVLLAWTILDFARRGRGTLAPWSPTERLVTSGPYRVVRNPMYLGVYLVLLGEAALSGSLAVLVWGIAFAAVSATFVLHYEEPNLERRFGEDYRRYCRAIPRWLPRITRRRGNS